MRAFVTAVFAFLYLPIALVVLFSFNAGHHASEFTGFSVQWYGKALANPFLVEALKNSLFIATTSALLAAVCGTAAALGLARVGPRTRAVFDALMGAAIVVPGVVIGISTLVALVQLFGVLNPFLASIRRGVTPEINAIATIVLVASVLLVVLAQWQLRQRQPSN
jgi:spermidine/putrescine transport system permease protein